MSFRGIQLITGTDSEETSLEHIGVNSPCDSWILPSNSYFTEAKIGYDSQGITYLKATTDRGVEFVRGYLKSTDSSTVQTFTKEQPLAGLQGYETRSTIKALGFIKYNCTSEIAASQAETQVTEVVAESISTPANTKS